VVSKSAKPYTCSQCRKGKEAGETPTYTERCAGCRAKKAAGLRTGLEPEPSQYPTRRRMNALEYRAWQTRVQKEDAARKRHMGALPDAREIR
jgi:hypothetical protein